VTGKLPGAKQPDFNGQIAGTEHSSRQRTLARELFDDGVNAQMSPNNLMQRIEQQPNATTNLTEI
jgi:hypothetical protein